jgi:hypothetical protein
MNDIGATFAGVPLGRPATMRDVCAATDALVTELTGGEHALRGEAKEARTEIDLRIAKLETRLAEVAGAVEVLRVQSEHAAAPERGPRGPKGPAGAPGASGASLASWRIDEERFIATPVMSDGATGPPLGLKSLLAAIVRALEAERH